jgi:hypothetical protein
MNYKMQLSSVSGTSETGLRMSLESREETKFFRSWLVYDSDLDATRSRGRINWNMVAGMALMVLVSAAGWYGIALLIRHLLN